MLSPLRSKQQFHTPHFLLHAMARTRRSSSVLEQFERPAKKARKAKTNAKKPQSAEVKTGIDIYPDPSPWHVGAHVSVAGGVENAVLNAASIGWAMIYLHPSFLLSYYSCRANAFALFLKSPRQWASGGLNPSNIENFKARMKEYHYDPRDVLPHGSYLINLGNPDAWVPPFSLICDLK